MGLSHRRNRPLLGDPLFQKYNMATPKDNLRDFWLQFWMESSHRPFLVIISQLIASQRFLSDHLCGSKELLTATQFQTNNSQPLPRLLHVTRAFLSSYTEQVRFLCKVTRIFSRIQPLLVLTSLWDVLKSLEQ